MQETYTFSRALHLMRYSGKKMRSILSEDDSVFYFVTQDRLMCHWNGKIFDVIKEEDAERPFMSYGITAEELMGSWVEVKE